MKLNCSPAPAETKAHRAWWHHHLLFTNNLRHKQVTETKGASLVCVWLDGVTWCQQDWRTQIRLDPLRFSLRLSGEQFRHCNFPWQPLHVCWTWQPLSHLCPPALDVSPRTGMIDLSGSLLANSPVFSLLRSHPCGPMMPDLASSSTTVCVPSQYRWKMTAYSFSSSLFNLFSTAPSPIVLITHFSVFLSPELSQPLNLLLVRGWIEFILLFASPAACQRDTSGGIKMCSLCIVYSVAEKRVNIHGLFSLGAFQLDELGAADKGSCIMSHEFKYFSLTTWGYQETGSPVCHFPVTLLLVVGWRK